MEPLFKMPYFTLFSAAKRTIFIIQVEFSGIREKLQTISLS